MLHNLSDKEVSVQLPDNLGGYDEVIFRSKDFTKTEQEIQLPAYSTVLLQD